MKDKKIVTILLSLTIIFTAIGGSLAYWTWNTTETQKTNVVFTIDQSFSCAADGGGNITSSDVMLAPTDCTNPELAIQRTVKVTPTINRSDLSIYMDLWLDVNTLGTGLSESVNFKYALTTSDNSCTEGVVSDGSFNGKTAGDTVSILNKKVYSASLTETYYLYIWLDKEETSSSTMNQEFSLSLNGSCTDAPQPEEPVLDNGMIPITLSEDGVATTVDKDDAAWYNYDEKEWANAVLVSDSSRSKYSGTEGVTVSDSDILAYYVWIPRYKYRVTALRCSEVTDPTMESHPDCYAPFTMSDTDKDGLITWWHEYYSTNMGVTDYTKAEATATVNEGLQTGTITMEFDGVVQYVSLAEFVMVYNSETSSNATYTGAFNGSNTTAGPSTLDIAFESATETMSLGNATTSYRTHSAFWWDNDSDGVVDSGETVAGIWVGKFETTGDATTPTVLPNKQSLRSQTVSTQFTTSQKFSASGNTYGLNNTGTNAHMMKNSEWGAVAYLSHSVYGINQEIYINNSSSYYTGRSGGNIGGSNNTVATQYSGQTSTNQYTSAGYYTWTGQTIAYDGTIGDYAEDRTLGTNASTTGNVTGVYDMSGGAWEYVMGVLADSEGNPRSGNSSSWNSGFNGLLADDTEYTSGIAFPDSKYFDLYKTSDATTACNDGICFGHALSETSGWYGDYAVFVSSDWPWFRRGGAASAGAGAGAFVFAGGVGVASRGARCLLSGMERSDLLFSDNVVTM